jgi:hypothetical protein
MLFPKWIKLLSRMCLILRMIAVRRGPSTFRCGWMIRLRMGIMMGIASRVRFVPFSLSLFITDSSFGYIALWPLFHYLLWQDVATEYASADSHYPYYESANAAFARRIAEVDQPGDIVGVHDYHLVLLPR